LGDSRKLARRVRWLDAPLVVPDREAQDVELEGCDSAADPDDALDYEVSLRTRSCCALVAGPPLGQALMAQVVQRV
jgi:hypothetical protein